MKNYFELYKRRNFSEKCSATFGFISENKDILMRTVLIALIPVAILGGIMYSVMDAETPVVNVNDFNDLVKIFNSPAQKVNQGITSMLTWVVTAGMVAFFLIYRERKGQVEDLTFSDFRGLFGSMMGKYFIMGLKMIAVGILACFVIVLALFFLSSMSPIVAVIGALALLVMSLPLLYLTPIYMFDEDSSISNAISTSYRYGIPTYWSLLGFIICIEIIVFFIDFIIGIGLGLVNVAADNIVVSIIINSIAYFVNGAISIVGVVAMIFQYGHAAERIDG